MRQFAAEWTVVDVVQQAVGQLPWGDTVLLDVLLIRPSRDWYAAHAPAGGWSRAVLAARARR